MRFVVKNMPRASYLEDGGSVEMTFLTADNDAVTMVFDPDSLEKWASRALNVIRQAQNQKRTKSGHYDVRFEAVAEIGVTAPTGGGSVILTMIGTNGIPMNYSLPLEECPTLRVALRKAEATAKLDSQKTRQ